MKPYLSIPISMKSDFYCNLLDWSSQDLIAVGSKDGLQLWKDFNDDEQPIHTRTILTDENLCSVQFNANGSTLAVGCGDGLVRIVDAQTGKTIRKVDDASDNLRGGPYAKLLISIAWNGDLLCSGGHARVTVSDLRTRRTHKLHTLGTHTEKICGLKWSPNAVHLASGCNNNTLVLWDLRRMPEPWQTHRHHTAAVKAIAWSPHHRGQIVTGGGLNDRCLRFWDTLTAQPVQRICTDSQICNVAWSTHSQELVTTQGRNVNQVILWKYPSLRPTASSIEPDPLNYMAMSPDGERMVTGTEVQLQFWRVFPRGGLSEENEENEK